MLWRNKFVNLLLLCLINTTNIMFVDLKNTRYIKKTIIDYFQRMKRFTPNTSTIFLSNWFELFTSKPTFPQKKPCDFAANSSTIVMFSYVYLDVHPVCITNKQIYSVEYKKHIISVYNKLHSSQWPKYLLSTIRT